MNTQIRQLIGLALTTSALLGITANANAQSTFSVEPGAPWQGYMNVFNLPADGGAYRFGSGWGTADLCATFAGPTLSLTPNTIADAATYWYIGGGGPGAQGNKTMEANFYVESGALSGQSITFTGEVLANTLTSSHTIIAFIKDFAPDYSSSVATTVALTPGIFNLNLATDPAAGRHVQYGFTMTGPDVWITDVAPYGSIQVTAVPEPSTLAIFAAAVLGVAAFRRQRK